MIPVLLDTHIVESLLSDSYSYILFNTLTYSQLAIYILHEDVNMMLYTPGSLGSPHNVMHSPTVVTYDVIT